MDAGGQLTLLCVQSMALSGWAFPPQLPQSLPHRHAQSCVSQAILDFVQLSVRIRQHRRHVPSYTVLRHEFDSLMVPHFTGFRKVDCL